MTYPTYVSFMFQREIYEGGTGLTAKVTILERDSHDSVSLSLDCPAERGLGVEISEF